MIDAYGHVRIQGKSENGFEDVGICEGAVISMPYGVAVAHGHMPGHTPWSKIGYNADIGNAYEDLWSPGGIYVFPTAAMGMEVVSSSTSDTSDGTGVRTVEIYYLDSTFSEKIETLTLNGTTPVPTVNTDIYRINRFIAKTCGTDGVSGGNISIRHLSDTPIYSQIPTGQVRSKKIIYTVPKNKILYISSVMVCAGANTAGRQVRFSTRANYCVVRLEKTSFFMDYSDILLQDGSVVMSLDIPTIFPEGVDIKVSAISPDGATKCSCMLRGWLETV